MKSTRFVLRHLRLVVCPQGEGRLLPGLLSRGAGSLGNPLRRSVIESLHYFYLRLCKEILLIVVIWENREKTTERESDHPRPSHFRHVLQSRFIFTPL